ncbi:hypothetical protein DMA11_23230 [Marinilabiliaceae bacterium JC017]|nr:hypothetical protein DMA11_23230 [Marinilabiliaceae bacterium JC017]
MKIAVKILSIAIVTLVASCSDDPLVKDIDPAIKYTDIQWDEREYKIHKCPVVNRTGYGMDLFRNLVVTKYDTTYIGDINGDGTEDYELTPVETALKNPNDTVDVLYMTAETETTYNWDIKFYNEYAVTYIEWSYSWNTLANSSIFMHPKTEACIVGQGVTAYENFTEADINQYIEAGSFSSDKSFPGDWEECREPTTGRYKINDIEARWVDDLIIGIHIHPGHTPYQPSGPCDNPDQVNTQPVWLIKTREGAYVKFQCPLFKGSGEDMQKCTVKWKTLREPEN